MTLASPPRRIVSLVPSQTELLYDLGLDESVVGITKFCIHPEHWRQSKSIVGGTKNIDLEAVHRLSPDLIIGNKEENERQQIEALRSHYPVWMSDISTLAQAMEMINQISHLTNTVEAGARITQEINEAFQQLRPLPALRTLYLMWRKPYMAAANPTFIHSMLEATGLINVLRDEQRYPTLTEDRMRELDPQVVLLSTEPFPFGERHRSEIQAILPKAKIMIVDGEMFSWYGSRLALAPDYFNSLTERL
ncbi:MAG: helical backbone metal receptor [Cyclobacteriaceae bacterium]|nr:helical backbone metal receptor [Cyclobacteriaceae bacterium]